jgi:luciferase-type oxidoreductase
VDLEDRGALFIENMRLIREVLSTSFPTTRSVYGAMAGTVDLLPKPTGRLPILVTGTSRQSLEWIAENSDGWITYPRALAQQAELALRWRTLVANVAPGVFKPFLQSLYVDLADEPDLPPSPIHLGFRGGRNFLIHFLEGLRGAGVHHVALNLKYGERDAGEVLEEIGQEVLPQLEAAHPAPRNKNSAGRGPFESAPDRLAGQPL